MIVFLASCQDPYLGFSDLSQSRLLSVSTKAKFPVILQGDVLHINLSFVSDIQDKPQYLEYVIRQDAKNISQPIKVSLQNPVHKELIESRHDTDLSLVQENLANQPKQERAELGSETSDTVKTSTSVDQQAVSESVKNKDTKKQQEIIHLDNFEVPETRALSPGRYVFSWKALRSNTIVDKGEYSFFVFDQEVKPESVKILPLSVESSAKAMAVLEIAEPYSQDLVVRWTFAGRVLSTSSIRNDGRVLIFDTPLRAGTYYLSAEIFPPGTEESLVQLESSGYIARSVIVTGDEPLSSNKASFFVPRALYENVYLLDGSLRSWSKKTAEPLTASRTDGWNAYGNYMGQIIGAGRTLSRRGGLILDKGLPVNQVFTFLLSAKADSIPNDLLLYQVIASEQKELLRFGYFPGHSGLSVLFAYNEKEYIIHEHMPESVDEEGDRAILLETANLGQTRLVQLFIGSNGNTLQIKLFRDNELLAGAKFLLEENKDSVEFNGVELKMGVGSDTQGLLAFAHGVAEPLVSHLLNEAYDSSIIAQVPVRPGAISLDMLPISQAENMTFSLPLSIPSSRQRFSVNLFDAKNVKMLEKIVDFGSVDSDIPFDLGLSLNGQILELKFANQESNLRSNKLIAYATIKYLGYGEVSNIISHYFVKK